MFNISLYYNIQKMYGDISYHDQNISKKHMICKQFAYTK